MKKKIIINGRFLTSPQTGVQRTASEMVKAIDELIDKGELKDYNFRYELIYSGKLQIDLKLKHIKISRKGMLTGNLWEQLELPLLSLGKPLINLCTIAPLAKRDQILFIHDISFKVNRNFFSKNFIKWYGVAIPWLIRTCSQIVTVSEFSKRELIKYFDVEKDRISVIYNAPEHILNVADAPEKFKNKIDALKPFCLAVSSLGANKNFNGLSKAIKKINFGKHKMLIAGGGLSVLKAELDEDNCTYLGYVSNEELKYLYSAAELFIFPSFYEGFGIPPLEAMICGCPVTASDTSSIPEILGTAAIYFDPKDTQEMGQTIQMLLNNPAELDRLRTLGYIQALKYHWSKSALELVKLTNECYGG